MHRQLGRRATCSPTGRFHDALVICLPLSGSTSAYRELTGHDSGRIGWGVCQGGLVYASRTPDIVMDCSVGVTLLT